jgi:hypothetical protein
VHELKDMTAKLLDIASRPQTFQTWHRNPPKHDPSQSPQQGKGKDGKGKGKGKAKGKGKGKGKEKGKGRGKGKGKITMPDRRSSPGAHSAEKNALSPWLASLRAFKRGPASGVPGVVSDQT